MAVWHRHRLPLSLRATDHRLDDETADALMQDVLGSSVGRTLLVITHDARHTSGFDEVLTLDAGTFLH
jgi:ABC-type transport system involved in cytochrome bd biosynthesis fused ATPase/permease subunit